MTLKPWKPRASKVGDYMACLWRAANDRAIYEGRVSPAEAQVLRAAELEREALGKDWYGPHGNIIHWTTQTGVGSVFAPQEPTAEEVEHAREHFLDNDACALAQGNANAVCMEFAAAEQRAHEAYRRGDPLAHSPTRSMWTTAAKGFLTPEAHQRAVIAASQLLAAKLPKPRDGRPWIAESFWETDYCTGHIDLLSHDHAEVEDIKTTAMPPEMKASSVKSTYLVQIVLYGRFTGARNGGISYVDSKLGMWSYRVPVNLDTPAMQAWGAELEDFCRFLQSDALWGVAYKNVGDHCRKSWCPYRVGCADLLIPKPGVMYDLKQAMRPTGTISLSSYIPRGSHA